MVNRFIKNSAVCIIMILCLSSCNKSDDNQISISEISDDDKYISQETTSVTTEIIHDEFINSDDDSEFENTYNYFKDIIDSDEIFECSYYSFPEYIDGYEYGVYGLYEEKPLVGVFEDELFKVGSFNLENYQFTPITVLSSNEYIIYSDKNGFIYKSSADISALSYYSFGNDKTENICYLSSDKVLTGSIPVFFDNSIYFDVYEYSNNNQVMIPNIYKYDLLNSELELYLENCEKPMLDNGKILALTKNDSGKYIVINAEDSNDVVYELNTLLSEFYFFNGECYGQITAGSSSSINNLSKNDKIISSVMSNGDCISELRKSNSFLYWNDYTGTENYPCMYDNKRDIIIQFNEFGLEYYCVWLYDSVGMIISDSSNRRVCIFKSGDVIDE